MTQKNLNGFRNVISSKTNVSLKKKYISMFKKRTPTIAWNTFLYANSLSGSNCKHLHRDQNDVGYIMPT